MFHIGPSLGPTNACLQLVEVLESKVEVLFCFVLKEP